MSVGLTAFGFRLASLILSVKAGSILAISLPIDPPAPKIVCISLVKFGL
jgi:hypothetical protein